MTGRHHHPDLFRKSLHGMARYEPCRLDTEPLEQLHQPRRPHFARKHPSRDVEGRIGSAVGSKPARDGIHVDAKRTQDLLGHSCSSSSQLTLREPSLRASSGGGRTPVGVLVESPVNRCTSSVAHRATTASPMSTGAARNAWSTTLATNCSRRGTSIVTFTYEPWYSMAWTVPASTFVASPSAGEDARHLSTATRSLRMQQEIASPLAGAVTFTGVTKRAPVSPTSVAVPPFTAM